MVDAWLIGFVVLLVLIVGGAIAWFLLGRRPVKFDPRHERLVQTLNRLHQDNPRKAVDVIARALVRGGLVWETDLQGLSQGSLSGGARPSFRQQGRDSSSGRSEGSFRPGEASRSEGRAEQPSRSQPQSAAKSQAQPAGKQTHPSASASPTGSLSSSDAASKKAMSRRSRRRRRRRPGARVGEQTVKTGSAE